jgi:hypothetical protein
MKMYIVQEIEEYKIFKVADNLVAEFEAEKKDCIVVTGNSIAEVVTEFEAMTKDGSLGFNSEMVKYKSVCREQEENEAGRIRQRQKL